MNDSPSTTLRDIADAAGVSVAAVSKVLNNRGGVSEESRQRVLQVADQLGYQGKTARAMHKAGVGTAALVVPADYYSDLQFYHDIIAAILSESAANSLAIEVRLLAPSDSRDLAEIGNLLASPDHGAIIAVGLNDAETIARIGDSGLPAVLINGMDRTMRVDSVLPDNWSAGWLATRHLLDAGHRNIMHVTLPLRLTMQRRMDGFRIAMDEAGISFDPAQHLLDLQQAGYAETQARAAIIEAFEAGRLANVTGFFCSTDMVAFGVIQGLQSLGLAVPDDFSVISIDDVAVAGNSRPPLTTMRIERAELGRIGVAQLLQRIAEPGRSVSRVNTGAVLVERATVAPPRR